MKKLIFAGLFLITVFSNAQVLSQKKAVSRPGWGPITNVEFRYYYLPDIDIYYDTDKNEFIYDKKGKWIRDKFLPSRSKEYDLYDGYTVIITDYNGKKPYVYHQKHLALFPKENRVSEREFLNNQSSRSTKTLIGQEGRPGVGATKSIPATRDTPNEKRF
ncbi:hypothetical protein BC749_10951 [Flavobacterium araucananum]|uniref:Uncharacterized protein n=1 Tax=Flavobacterium araucananum TaxID=946678 RepID=A0A227P556_9FLAO|nr:hypothetical protein [Flavobacterium araucananum]OXG05061.1 hypothetical protein B0A64_13595 [Flavobacterium araucananum]PWJ96775.1 hypothetical protein BC749_10951 [Flavobacterium araucananum]